MKKFLAILSSAALLITMSAASASADSSKTCQTQKYTAIGGYYSQGQYYQESNDTVTVKAKWCYSNDVITSHRITYTTTISSSQDPRLTKHVQVSTDTSNLNLSVTGNYNSGVLNNTATVGLTGTLRADGTYTFSTVSGDGG